MSYTRVGVVTGANKGIGYAIVRQLALQYPSSPLNNGPLLIWTSIPIFKLAPVANFALNLTSRDASRGQSALDSLQQDPALKKAKALSADGGLATIKYHSFDVTNKSTVDALAAHLKEAHPNGIDFFINNAGIALDGFNAEIVKKTLETNYYATLSATEKFISSLTSSGRLINLASSAGTLGRYSPEVRQGFLDAAKKGSMADVDVIMKSFADAVKKGKEKDEGFPSAAYAVSKAGLIAGTKVLGASQTSKDDKQIYSVDPGYVNTDMSKGNGTRTPDEGADTSVKLALKIVGGRGDGDFWRDGREVEW